MDELTQQQKENLQDFAKKVDVHPNLPVVEVLQNIASLLKEIVDKEAPESPELPEFPTKMDVEVKGAELVTIKGEKGDKGDQGDKGEKGDSIKGDKGDSGKDSKVAGPKGDKGDPGKDVDESAITKEVIKSLTPIIPKIEDIEKDLPKLGEKIRDSLELLKDDNRLDISAIKDLKENLDTMHQIINAPKDTVMMASIAGRDIFKQIDLSAQLNGVTTTFQISAVWVIVSVALTSFPYNLRNTIDFTYTPTSITFLVDAATALATGQTCVLVVVNS